MELKYIGSNSSYHSGYGAGSGSVDRTEYECPCGKGKVIYEKDNIPGFRDSMTFSDCTECNSKYHFSRGEAELIQNN